MLKDNMIKSNEFFKIHDISDLINNKKMTLPLILCYQRGNIKEKIIIESILSKNNIVNDDFQKIVNIMVKYNIKSDCLAKAKHVRILTPLKKKI